MIVRSSDESLGLESDTSEESQERLNDEDPDVEAAEETASSNDSENEPSRSFTHKSPMTPSQVLSRRQEEECATGKPDRQ
jgi:hypothetical protein